MKKLLFLLYIFFSTVINIYAVFGEGSYIKRQPDGTEIEIFWRGDEYDFYMSDKDGYTVIQNVFTGYYTYAIPGKGKMVPSQYIVGKHKPPAISKNLWIDEQYELNYGDRDDIYVNTYFSIPYLENESLKIDIWFSAKTTICIYVKIRFIPFNYWEKTNHYKNFHFESHPLIPQNRLFFGIKYKYSKYDSLHSDKNVKLNLLKYLVLTGIIDYDSKPYSHKKSIVTYIKFTELGLKVIKQYYDSGKIRIYQDYRSAMKFY